MMKKFIITKYFKKNKIEDAYLEQKARETLKRIELGEEKTLPWKLARNKTA